MIRTITPYTLDELQYLLGSPSGRLDVYFPLFDQIRKQADYFAEVTWDAGRIEYTLEGHGIGSNFMSFPDREKLIERIISDNGRFNGGGPFHIEAPDSSREQEAQQAAPSDGDKPSI